MERGGGGLKGARGEGLRVWGFRYRRKGFNSAGLGGKKEAVTIESVVRDVFTDGALGLGFLIGDWKWGPER